MIHDKYFDYEVMNVFKLGIKLRFEMSNLPERSAKCSAARCVSAPAPAIEWIFMWFLRSPGGEKDRGHSSQGCGLSLTWVMRW